MSGTSTPANFVVKNGLTVGTTQIATANGAIYANGLFYSGSTNSITDYANSAFTKANNAVQTGFTTISANGTNITPTSNNDTLTINGTNANGIYIFTGSKEIDISLATSGASAGSYGSSTAIPSLTVDKFGRITSISTNSVSTTVNLSGTIGTGSVSGGGTLTFASNNGVVISASGSTITISDPQDLQTSASPSFTNLTITGNLSIAGTSTYSNTQIFQTVDSLIELAANNAGDAVDIGFYGLYNSSGNKYAGLVRTAASNFVLFKDLSSAPTSNAFSTINVGNYGTLRANITGGTVSSLASAIGISDGGTNATSFTSGQLINYSGSALQSIANVSTSVTGGLATSNTISSLTVDSYGRVTAYTGNAIAIDTSQITSGTLPINRGGTNQTSFSANTLSYFNGTAIASLANTSSSGTWGGSTQIPYITVDNFGRVTAAGNTSISTSISLSGTTGTGSVSGGGTLTFASNNGVVVSASGSTITISSPQDLQTSASPSFNAAKLNTSAYLTSTVFTTSTTGQTAIDSFATATYRSAKYLAQITSGSSYHFIELIVIHDGTTPFVSQYGEVFTSSSLGTFDASITTGNLSLLFTPTNATTTIKLMRTNIVV